MAGKARGNQPGRRRIRSGIRADDAIIGAMAGFGLIYFVLTPHGFEHPWHWVAAGVGGLLGGVGIWAYAERDSLPDRLRRLGEKWRPGGSEPGPGRKRRA